MQGRERVPLPLHLPEEELGGVRTAGTEVGNRGDRYFFLDFIFSFGNAASRRHAVTVKIRFKLQGWLWLFPFLSEFLPTCNLLNEILLFRLTGIFFADVDLTQLCKICELCSFFPIFNNLRILVQELDRVYNVDSTGWFVPCKHRDGTVRLPHHPQPRQE